MCAHAHTNTHMRIDAHTDTHLYKHINIFTHTHTNTHLYTHGHTHVLTLLHYQNAHFLTASHQYVSKYIQRDTPSRQLIVMYLRN